MCLLFILIVVLLTHPFFFFNDTATTEIYTLSLHDALPILGLCETLKTMEAEADALWASRRAAHRKYFQAEERLKAAEASMREDRKSTRLNSSHQIISYAVFCLKKKKNTATSYIYVEHAVHV